MSVNRIMSKKAPAAIGCYSQASLSDGLIITSGQLPLNTETGSLQGTTIEEQTTQSLKNVQAILEDNNSSLESILKTTVYLSDMANFKGMNDAYSKFFTEGNYPARTAFQVAALPMNALVEIEVIAKIESEEN